MSSINGSEKIKKNKKIYLSLGSNLDDRLGNLRRAAEELVFCFACFENFKITDKSFVYETPPFGMTEQPPFLNACLAAEIFGAEPLDILKKLKTVEKTLGRLDRGRWGPREIDIDLLFIDDLIVSERELCVPHSQIQQRAFVLLPLADIAPDFIHPILKRSVKEMLASLPPQDLAGINKITKL